MLKDKELDLEVTRWTSVGSYDKAYRTKTGYQSQWSWASTLALSICHAAARRTPHQYLTMTQAWRPLDLHPDWRTWDGATTKGNK